MFPPKLFTKLSDAYINQPSSLPNSSWSCYSYSNKMQKVPRNSCENYLGYFMNQFGFFFSSPTFTNMYCICTLSIRTAWKQSGKKTQTTQKLNCEAVSPFPTSDYYLFYSFLNTTTEETQHMIIVPKPTPNCFAFLCIFPSRFSHLLLQTEHLEATKARLILLHQSSLFVWCFLQIWKFFN